MQLGNYYEARCGKCNAFLYGTRTGDTIHQIECHHCGEMNLFDDSTEVTASGIHGKVASRTSADSARTGNSLSPLRK